MIFVPAAGGLSAAQTAKILALPRASALPAAATGTITDGGGTSMTVTDIAAIDGQPAKLRIVVPAEAADHIHRWMFDRGTTTRIDVLLRICSALTAFTFVGVGYQENATGKFGNSGAGANNDLSGINTFANRWTNDTTFSANFASLVTTKQIAVGEWFRLRCDYNAGDASMIAYVFPGRDRPSSSQWQQTGTSATGFFTTAADKVGICILAPTGSDPLIVEVEEVAVS